MFLFWIGVQLILVGALLVVGYIDIRFNKKEYINYKSMVGLYLFLSFIVIILNYICR